MRNIRIVTDVVGISEYSFPVFHDHYPQIDENIMVKEQFLSEFTEKNMPICFVVTAVIHTDIGIIIGVEPDYDFDRLRAFLVLL